MYWLSALWLQCRMLTSCVFTLVVCIYEFTVTCCLVMLTCVYVYEYIFLVLHFGCSPGVAFTSCLYYFGLALLLAVTYLVRCALLLHFHWVTDFGSRLDFMSWPFHLNFYIVLNPVLKTRIWPCVDFYFFTVVARPYTRACTAANQNFDGFKVTISIVLNWFSRYDKLFIYLCWCFKSADLLFNTV